MTAVQKKIHILLMPLYDWKNNPIGQQIRSNLEKLRKREKLGSLLVLVKAGFLFLFNLLFYPLGILLSLGKYRILCVDLSQLGSVFYLDVRIKELLMEDANRNFIVPVNPYWSRNNKTLISLYRPYALFAETIFFKLLLVPFYYNRFLAVNTKSIDGKDSRAYSIFNRYQKTKTHEPLISLSREQVQACREEMLDMGIGEIFVALHVRDSGFYGESWDSMRNADIDTYYQATQFLIRKGFQVVRMGSPQARPPSEELLDLNPDFFDYARSSLKSETMDIFLLQEAAFFIGTASGPFTIASILSTPVLTTNHFSPADSMHLHETDLSIFKKYVHSNGKNVNLIHLFSDRLRFNPSLDTLTSMGLTVVDNTALELLEAVEEFCQRRMYPSLPTPLNDQLRDITQRMVPDAIWRPGRFGESFLRRYIENQSLF